MFFVKFQQHLQKFSKLVMLLEHSFKNDGIWTCLIAAFKLIQTLWYLRTAVRLSNESSTILLLMAGYPSLGSCKIRPCCKAREVLPSMAFAVAFTPVG